MLSRMCPIIRTYLCPSFYSDPLSRCFLSRLIYILAFDPLVFKMRGPGHPIELRVQALTLITFGVDIRAVEAITGMPRTTIQYLVRKARERGYNPAVDPRIRREYVEDGKRSGRPRTAMPIVATAQSAKASSQQEEPLSQSEGSLPPSEGSLAPFEKPLSSSEEPLPQSKAQAS